MKSYAVMIGVGIVVAFAAWKFIQWISKDD